MLIALAGLHENSDSGRLPCPEPFCRQIMPRQRTFPLCLLKFPLFSEKPKDCAPLKHHVRISRK